MLMSCLLLSAGENVLAPRLTGDWERINGSSEISMIQMDGEAMLRIRGVGNYRTNAVLPVQPGKIYKLSGEFKAGESTVPARLFFGMVPLDAKLKQIASGEVFAIPGTETQLAADANAGDTVIRIIDGSKWKENAPFTVAFKTGPAYSDLPNRNLSPTVKNVSRKNGWHEVTLASPLKQSYSSGTGVREHRHASTYPYSAAGNRKLSGEWQEFSAIIKGEAVYGTPLTQWWHGTRNAALLVLANSGGNGDSVLLMKNIRLEELTR